MSAETKERDLQEIGAAAYSAIVDMVNALKCDWDREAEEFNILLATGGPAVRIVGELDQGEPSRAWLEVQDWFTPWTEYVGTTSKSDPGMLENQASQDVLLTYARQFYFGS
jgi:hypothetical protein